MAPSPLLRPKAAGHSSLVQKTAKPLLTSQGAKISAPASVPDAGPLQPILL